MFERFEAFFTGHAYDPHRHDRYAIGYTLSGVQLFRYRGAQADSRRGNALVIHPDELHDGHAGRNAGFCYRMLYVEPHHIREALQGTAGTLPFVPRAVLDDDRLIAALRPLLGDLSRPLEPLEIEQGLLNIAEALLGLDPSLVPPRRRTIDLRAVERARTFLDAHHGRVVSADEIERVSGLDRYNLARQFRNRLGTSPFRYLIMRRLDRARTAMLSGTPLADVAALSGFADQSHMTRFFKRAFGLPPGRWLALQKSSGTKGRRRTPPRLADP